MATYRNRCGNCGWTHVGRDSGPSKCPCCDRLMPSAQVIAYDSPEEKESFERTRKQDKKTILMMLLCVALTFVLAFPGTLVLMLLHTIVDIDSYFWNWLLSIVFSGLIFLICKGDIMTYLKIDIYMIGVSTILGWCISGFRPWEFAISTFFCNPWLVILCIFAGIFIIGKYCHPLLDKFIVK